jgi:hypothetical protein
VEKNGVNITGATFSTYTITAVTETDEADYDVVISDANGSKTSTIGTLTVNQVSSSFTFYYGFNDTGSITAVADIFALQFNALVPLGATEIDGDFRSNATPKYLIWAEPATEPQKHYFFGDINNNGPIGGSNDLIGPPLSVGAFRVYITNYPDIQYINNP